MQHWTKKAKIHGVCSPPCSWFTAGKNTTDFCTIGLTHVWAKCTWQVAHRKRGRSYDWKNTEKLTGWMLVQTNKGAILWIPVLSPIYNPQGPFPFIQCVPTVLQCKPCIKRSWPCRDSTPPCSFSSGIFIFCRIASQLYRQWHGGIKYFWNYWLRTSRV